MNTKFTDILSTKRDRYYVPISFNLGRGGLITSLALNVPTVDYFIIFNYFVIKPSHFACSFRTTNVVLLQSPQKSKSDANKCHHPIYIGQGWIRTTVGSHRQIYSLFPLATRAPTLIIFFNLPLMGFEPMASPLPRECATPAPQRLNIFKVIFSCQPAF